MLNTTSSFALQAAPIDLSNEWYTPEDYVEAARFVLGEIDLDPATHPIAQEWIKAKNFFTEVLGAVRIDGARYGRREASQRDRLRHAHRPSDLDAQRRREPIDVTPALHEYLDTLQAPAEPPDLVAVASGDEGKT